MGRKINSEVNLKEIHFDEDLYPRSKYDWRTAYIYSQAMNSGAKFPPIVLALLNGKKYLVDGKHRTEANILNKKEKIEAIVHTGWNKKKIFLEAVKANISHGKILSPYEKRRIALKLREYDSTNGEISQIIQVPEDKLENFIAQRLVNTMTGEPIDPEEGERLSKEIGHAILKSGIKHFAGETMSEEDFIGLEETQKSFYGSSQFRLFNEVVRIIESDMLDKNNKSVMKLVEKLKILIKEKL